MSTKVVLVGNWREPPERMRRALASVARHVFGVCISVDPAHPADAIALQEFVREFNLPAHIFFTPRPDNEPVAFCKAGGGGALRTEVMREGESFARTLGAEYLLYLDGDDELAFDEPFQWPAMADDCYVVDANEAGVWWPFKALFRVGLDWRFRGVAHERAYCERQPFGSPAHVLPGVHYIKHTDVRAPSHYIAIAEKCKVAYAAHPEETEYPFCIAMSYLDAKMPVEAREWFERYLELPDGEAGWRYVSAMGAVDCAALVLTVPMDMLLLIARAVDLAPDRAEPWRALTRFAEYMADRMPLPPHAIMLDKSAYRMTTARPSV